MYFGVLGSSGQARWYVDIHKSMICAISELTRLACDTQTPQEERIKVLMEVCNSTKNEAVKVKCIGTLESLAQNTESIEANRVSSSSFVLSQEYSHSMLPDYRSYRRTSFRFFQAPQAHPLRVPSLCSKPLPL